MLQYKIPQDVQAADKIVGPLTLKQLVICGVGFGLAYMLYMALVKTYYIEVWLPPVLFICGFTGLIAFVEIKSIPFTKWVLLMIEAMMNPHLRVWDKQQSTQFLFHYSTTKTNVPDKEKEKEKKKEEVIQKKKTQAGNIHDIASALDISTVFEEKKPEDMQKNKQPQTEEDPLLAEDKEKSQDITNMDKDIEINTLIQSNVTKKPSHTGDIQLRNF